MAARHRPASIPALSRVGDLRFISGIPTRSDTRQSRLTSPSSAHPRRAQLVKFRRCRAVGMRHLGGALVGLVDFRTGEARPSAGRAVADAAPRASAFWARSCAAELRRGERVQESAHDAEAAPRQVLAAWPGLLQRGAAQARSACPPPAAVRRPRCHARSRREPRGQQKIGRGRRPEPVDAASPSLIAVPSYHPR